MNIEQLKKDKQKLEENIQKQLNGFSKKYKIFVKDVEVISDISRNLNGITQSKIYVNVKIEL